MKMILTSECEECKYGIIDDGNKAKIKVFCQDKRKEYYYGQCIPCENKTKKVKKGVSNASKDKETERQCNYTNKRK